MPSLHDIAKKIRPHLTKENAGVVVFTVVALAIFYQEVGGALLLCVAAILLCAILWVGSKLLSIVTVWIPNSIDALRGHPRARARDERIYKMLKARDTPEDSGRKETSPEP